jgi:hypothetical protein
MALADESDVRSLIGNPTVRQVTDNQLDIPGTLTEADKMVYAVTRKDDWTPDDYGWEWAKDAATKLAASKLISQFYDPKDKSKVYRDDFEFDLSVLRRIGFGGAKDSGNPLSAMAVGSYKRDIRDEEPYMSRNVFGEHYFKDRSTNGEFTIDE